jgi:hypothetical protein
MHRP